MAEQDFFSPAARSRATSAVKAIEAVSAAEVVVQVRHVAGRYRDADYLCGFGASLLALLVLLFAPRTFRLASFPVQLTLAFALGAWSSSRLPWLRRLFVRAHTMESELQRSARAAFYELGIARTRGRTGLLVVAATFERRVAVVCDVGIAPARLGPGWTEALAALTRAVARRDLDAFDQALRRLGPVLGAALPRQDDDVNELPDEQADESAGQDVAP